MFLGSVTGADLLLTSLCSTLPLVPWELRTAKHRTSSLWELFSFPVWENVFGQQISIVICVHVCVYVAVYVCAHIPIYKYRELYKRVSIYCCLCTCICVYILLYEHACVYILLYVHVCVLYIPVHMYIFLYVNVGWCMDLCACLFRGQRLISGLLPHFLQLGDRLSLWTWSSQIWLDCLSNEVGGICRLLYNHQDTYLPPRTGITDVCCQAGDPNSGPPSCLPSRCFPPNALLSLALLFSLYGCFRPGRTLKWTASNEWKKLS